MQKKGEKGLAGKKWLPEEEAKLRELIEAEKPIAEIAVQLQKTPSAVILKCQRLGLAIKTSGLVDSTVMVPKELPSVEEALRMLAGALRAAVKPGLSRVEVQRLQAVAAISKTYKEILTDYINYREIESKLKELEQQNAQLQKQTGQSPTPQPDNALVA